MLWDFWNFKFYEFCSNYQASPFRCVFTIVLLLLEFIASFLGTFKLIFAKRVNWKVIGFLWKVRCKLNGSLFLIKTEVTLKFRLLLLIEEKIEIQNEMFNLRFPKNILDFSKREKPINFLYCLCFWQANLKRKNFPPQKTKRTENNFCRFYSWHLIAFT